MNCTNTVGCDNVVTTGTRDDTFPVFTGFPVFFCFKIPALMTFEKSPLDPQLTFRFFYRLSVSSLIYIVGFGSHFYKSSSSAITLSW